LIVSSLVVLGVAFIIPSTSLGELFGFVEPPFAFFIILTGLIGAYLFLVEIVKKWFFKRYSHLLEQVLVPQRKVMKAT